MAKKTPPKGGDGSSALGSFLSWAAVAIGVVALVYLFMQIRPDGHLVCDTGGREPSLTHFGDCHME